MSVSADILIAEDEEMLREVLKDILCIAGYNIITVENGSKALEILKRYKIPLLLCDISMPEINGLELLEHMKRDGIETSVVMLTAHSEKEKIIKALQLGALDYIIKPFQGDKLLLKVELCLELGKRLATLSDDNNGSDQSVKQKLRMIELFKIKNSNISFDDF